MAAVVRERIATALLGGVAGYVDTAGFLGLGGLFTAHVTGNLVVAGAEIAGRGGDAVWVRLLVIPVFIAAVVLVTVLLHQRWVRLSQFLWLEAIVLLLFLVVGVVSIPTTAVELDAGAMFITGSVGVFAMGVQNALMREALGTLAPTTVMTGNLTQFVIDFVHFTLIHHAGHAEAEGVRRRELRQRLLKFGGVLLSFVVGAALGAWLMGAIGFWSIALPVLVVLFLALDTQRREAQGAAEIA